MLRRAALVALAALAIAGCTSTVVLGTLTTDAAIGVNDLSQPIFDFSDGGIDGSFDGGVDGLFGDGGPDLAQ